MTIAGALLTDDNDQVVVEWPLTKQRAWELRPGQHNLLTSADPSTRQASHIWLYEAVAPPPTAWGESAAQETPEQFAPGQWRQKWRVTSITLAEAKSRLAQMAIDIYKRKVDDEPLTGAEMTAAAGSISAIKAAREASYKPLVATARTQIQALNPPATIADAYQIYRDLEAVP